MFRRMMLYGVGGTVLALAVVVALQAVPDIVRYMKIRNM